MIIKWLRIINLTSKKKKNDYKIIPVNNIYYLFYNILFYGQKYKFFFQMIWKYIVLLFEVMALCFLI